jgi:hypothetical protein
MGGKETQRQVMQQFLLHINYITAGHNKLTKFYYSYNMVSYNSIQEKKNLENQDDPTIFWEDERV